MNVGSICKRPIVTIDAGESLQRTAMLMREHHVGALVVIEASEDSPGPRVKGVVTDRDLAIEVLARGGDVMQVPVGRLAQSHLASVPEEADLIDAVALMRTRGVRRLLVSDAEGLLVGLLSFDDLLPACVAPLAGLADVLRAGLEREVAERGAIAAPVRPVLRVPIMGSVGWTYD
jgi:CBS domain-containing protein